MEILIAQKLGIFLTVLIGNAVCAPSERRPRQSPFGRMGASPFHTPSGPMGGMGHMGPSMGGPTMGGQSRGSSNSMFTTSVGLGCVRHDIVCPKWCLAMDANGCKSCPCGPGGGMNTLAGGPSGGPMGSPMGGAMSSGPMGGAMPMGSGPSGGNIGGGGGVTGVSMSGGGVSGGGGGGGIFFGGSVSGGGTVSSQTTSTQTYGAAKPVKACAATLLCTSTCKGYTLGSTSSSGCRSCSCPSSHHVSTTTIKYIVETVKPANKECTVTAYCMRSCSGGYVMSKTDGYGCPECSCIKVEKPYVPPIEIAVEPPEYTQQIQTYTLTCAAHSCSSSCTVGYKCGRDGCPSCECIHPTVVGLTTVHQVYTEKPLRCRNTLACPSRCSLGYKCGSDGCPTCQCLVASTSYVQTRPQYTAQTCTHTLTCAATCTNGYELFSDGTGSCSKCACKQQVVYETRPQYTVQRPGPQYQIVECPSTDSCSTQCPHGYEVVRNEGSCPTCQCKQAPVYYTVMTSNKGCDNCHESYYTSGSTYSGGSVGNVIGSGSGSSSGGGTNYVVSGGSGTSYVVSGGSEGSGTGYIVSGGSGESGTSYVMPGGSGGSGTSYVVSGDSGGNVGGSRYTTGGFSYGGQATYGSAECEPLPPDCQPSCIVYDDPHCRRCACETSYVRYSHG